MTQRYTLFSAILIGLAFTLFSSGARAQSNWRIQNTGISADLKGISFLDTRTGFTVGDVGTVMKTTDGGTTWNLLEAGCKKTLWTVTAYRDHMLQPHVIVAGEDGACCVSSDEGLNWTPMKTGVTDGGIIYSVQVLNDTTIYLTGSDANGNGVVAMSTDNGATWTERSDKTAQYFGKTTFVNPSIGYGIGESKNGSALIEKTTDGGGTWTTLQNYPENIRGLGVFDADHLVAVGDASTLVSTSDGGLHWFSIAMPVVSEYQSLMFRDVNHGVAAGTGAVVSTTTAGDSWIDTHYPGSETLSQAVLLANGSIVASGPSGTIATLASTESVDANTKEVKVVVTPNPAHERIAFQVDDASNMQVSLYNALGVEALHATLGADGSIDCSKLPKGTYYFKLIRSSASNDAAMTGSVVLL